MTTSASSTNLRLNDFERVSPAQSLDLTVGYDAEGWPISQIFRVGQIVASRNGRLYKVIGFSLDNEVLTVQYGLEQDPAIKSVAFLAEGLEAVEAPITSWSAYN